MIDVLTPVNLSDRPKINNGMKTEGTESHPYLIPVLGTRTIGLLGKRKRKEERKRVEMHYVPSLVVFAVAKPLLVHCRHPFR